MLVTTPLVVLQFIYVTGDLLQSSITLKTNYKVQSFEIWIIVLTFVKMNHVLNIVLLKEFLYIKQLQMKFQKF